MNIIGYRKIYYTVSGILVLISWVFLIVWGLKLGIEFTGGSLIEVGYKDARPAIEEIKQKLEPLNLGTVNITPTDQNAVMLRLKDVDESTHQQILGALKDGKELDEKRFESVGPTIGRELKTRSVQAIIIVLFAIVIYLAWAFHDVSIPLGVFSLLGKFYGVEIDTLFVTAILTVLGFSVHDTIVVFDRIRENLKKGGVEHFNDIVNKSVNETLTRSINTSLTVLFVLLAIYFFGGATIANFSLTLIIGIIAGTYSSIFIASPLVVSWELWARKGR
ncbi:MAG: Protein translocase subunit SecF [Candidatus Azambacteria bacterium GW2011_GWE2_46_45]|uniref:Protein-export membrane protein SecF n=1 Tax=Candidatus Azambacteria bacterium GW2011_GWE2_46_45 TaxID=1618625 RepID=A0A0G1SD08_9BACT|nr:MAG: Protein translocase subunit SecF [Candidatus Azambacteria bacterium GW2011_GWE2_46_45]